MKELLRNKLDGGVNKIFINLWTNYQYFKQNTRNQRHTAHGKTYVSYHPSMGVLIGPEDS